MAMAELYERVRFRGQPGANAAAVVVRDDVRVTVLTPRLLRLEWSEVGEFEDRSTYAFPTRYVDRDPEFDLREENGVLIIDTGPLTMRYRLGTGRFTAENLEIAVAFDGESVSWHPGMDSAGNLFGTRHTLDECAGDAPLELGPISRDGWALFDDSKNVVFGDDGWVGPRPDYEFQDWYFFGYGHDYTGALQDYTTFGGDVPLIPRFVLGGWWSRYWAYSEQDLRDLVKQFEDHDVPLDVFVVDMDWHTPHSWTGYTWNRDLFPDPPAFLGWLHDKGLRVTLNLHPAEGIQSFEQVYEQMARAMGIDPETGETVPFRIADKVFVKHYFELIHHRMEDEGVDFWWMDWQQGEISEVKGLDPLPWINHLHFNDIKRRGVRPMLYSRWGGLGNHRYYIGFSGDTIVGWDALQFQPYMTATASNVLYGWWSHDIGGHMGGATEPELYARWVQFGAVSPVLRLHATKDPRCERRPWAYPAPYAEAAMAAFHLRYRLTPYLYTMARVAADTSVSLCRPMYYEDPEADAAYATRYQYYLGDQMIVAPIVFPADPETDLASVDVWIPEGTWTAYDSLETFEGPGWVRMLGDINRIPMLVKAGGILPLAPDFAPQPDPALASGNTDAQPLDTLVLQVLPGEGSLRVYRDDGVTNDYRDGAYEWLPVRTEQIDGGRAWHVDVSLVQGRCPSLPDHISYEVMLMGCHRPASVLVDGEVAAWRYDADRSVCTVTIPDVAVDAGFELVVTAVEEIVALGDAHNRALRLDDIARLAGEPGDAEIAGLDDLLGHRDTMGEKAFQDAIARLGGPFFHSMEFVTPDEAAHQLGRVVISAPSKGEPMDVVVHFETHFEGESTSYDLSWDEVADDLIVDTPFELGGTGAFETRIRRGEWTVEVLLTWRNVEIRGTYTSAPLFPSITAWRAVVYDRAECEMAVGDALSEFKMAASGANVETLAQDLTAVRNFSEPFVLRLWDLYSARLEADEQLAGYFATICTSPDARQVILELWASEPLEVIVNGEPVDLVIPDVDPDVPSHFAPPLRTVPFKLASGDNDIVLDTRAPDPDEGRWFLSARVLSPTGEDLVDLSFR